MKKLVCLLAGLLVTLPGWADTLALTPDHPQQYVVVKGDTLWDISARFLRDPWRWPQIWEKNPQIRNPHLIYPGDVVSLVYQDGKPMLRVRRGGRPVVKLSPGVRATPYDLAIPVIPFDAIGQFLTESRVVTDEELEAAPYVVSLGKEHLIGGPDSRVYVRGLEDGGAARRYAVYRRGRAYRNEGAPADEVLGFEAVHVADAVVQSGGDPTTMLLTKANREVLKGDRLLPVQEDEYQEPYNPREPADAISGSIIAVVDGVTQIGQHQVVVLNLGREAGLEVGHVLAVYQRGEMVEDKFQYEQQASAETSDIGLAHGIDRDIDLLGEKIKRAFVKEKGVPVKLPDERAGVLMVFRTFEKVSYALVMEASRAMHLYDTVKKP